MSNSDYIPRTDPEFNIWQGNLIAEVDLNATTWNIPADVVTAVKGAQSTWTAAYLKADNVDNRTHGDVTMKNRARTAYEKKLRPFIQEYITFNSKITDGQRESMGLKVRNNSRTPAQVPETRPVGRIEFTQRLQHIIHFSDELSPLSKAKPAGVHGCEIWVKIDGESPKKASELNFLGTETETPYIASFDGEYAGKMAYYWLRWVNTKGQTGPWSVVVSATIMG